MGARIARRFARLKLEVDAAGNHGRLPAGWSAARTELGKLRHGEAGTQAHAEGAGSSSASAASPRSPRRPRRSRSRTQEAAVQREAGQEAGE